VLTGSLTGAAAELVALLLLAAVLVFAMLAPRGLSESVVAVPAAGLAVLLGLIGPHAALRRIAELGPTVGFLAAILVLAHLADAEGVFRWLGEQLAVASAGDPGRLLRMVFVAASLTTAVLSLDATVVLLTPVVFGTAVGLRLRARPHVFACAHLANSASLLLPVSNLTNLLAFTASGLSFTAFAGLMVLPWLAVIGVELLVFRRFFAAELTGRSEVVAPAAQPMPRYALLVLALTLAGFGLSGLVGIEPVWVAVAGALVLAGPALARRRVTPSALVMEASPLFCLFVLALGIVVTAVTAHGLGRALTALVPDGPPGLSALFAVAALAAVLSNVVNNLPATLALLGAFGAGTHPGLVLAALLGVNIGPNLTYTGSLATLLWRRVLARSGDPDATPRLREFVGLGALTVPLGLLVAVPALWLGLTLLPALTR
jgi:arsenical pump membrane protein